MCLCVEGGVEVRKSGGGGAGGLTSIMTSIISSFRIVKNVKK